MRPAADGHARVAGLAERPRPAVLCEQHVALRMRFRELLLELVQRRFQRVDLRALIDNLLAKAFRRALAALVTLERRPRQVVLAAVDRQLGLAHPFGGFRLVLLLLLLQHVLVGNRDGHLRFHLQQLVLHVENHLLDHLRRVFGPVDQIVQIGAQQR